MSFLTRVYLRTAEMNISAVASFGPAQFKLHPFALGLHNFLREAHHQLGELRLVLAHELRQATYLAEHDLLTVIAPPSVSLALSAHTFS